MYERSVKFCSGHCSIGQNKTIINLMQRQFLLYFIVESSNRLVQKLYLHLIHITNTYILGYTRVCGTSFIELDSYAVLMVVVHL